MVDHPAGLCKANTSPGHLYYTDTVWDSTMRNLWQVNQGLRTCMAQRGHIGAAVYMSPTLRVAPQVEAAGRTLPVEEGARHCQMAALWRSGLDPLSMQADVPDSKNPTAQDPRGTVNLDLCSAVSYDALTERLYLRP